MNVARKFMAEMTQKEAIFELSKNGGGLLRTKDVTEAGISRAALKSLVDGGAIAQVQRGIYVTEGGYADDFFLLQQRYSKGIYSHETALYLLGFSDRAPIQLTMTFKHGQSTTRMKEDNVRPVMVSKNFETGVMEIARPGETTVKTYGIERTLVDLLKPRYDADYEQLMPALKRYAASENRDINKMYRYARLFGVEERVQNYMGALL